TDRSGALPTTPVLAANVPAHFASLGISAGGHISNVDTLTTYTGDTPQTGDMYGAYVAFRGTATAGGPSTITLQTVLGIDELVRRNTIAIIGGTGAGQTMNIAGYVNSTKVVTVDQPWAIQPDNTSVYL